MSAVNVVLFTFLLVLAYLVTPTLLVWGWARWIKQRPRLWTISLALSFGRQTGRESALACLSDRLFDRTRQSDLAAAPKEFKLHSWRK
jgi:hypothetical protein